VTADCPSGQHILGGGGGTTDPVNDDDTVLLNSLPIVDASDANAPAWQVSYEITGVGTGGLIQISAYAICAA
jgi:hypothetical protein